MTRIAAHDGDRELLHWRGHGLGVQRGSPQILSFVVLRSPLTGLFVDDELDAGGVWRGPERVGPGGERQTGECNRRRCGELCRSVCACSPDAVVVDHGAKQGATAREWPAIVHGNGGGANLRPCGIAHAQLRGAAAAFRRGKAGADRLDVGKVGGTCDEDFVGGPHAGVGEHPSAAVDARFASAGEPVVSKPDATTTERMHVAPVQRKARADVAVGIELAKLHAVASIHPLGSRAEE